MLESEQEGVVYQSNCHDGDDSARQGDDLGIIAEELRQRLGAHKETKSEQAAEGYAQLQQPDQISPSLLFIILYNASPQLDSIMLGCRGPASCNYK